MQFIEITLFSHECAKIILLEHLLPTLLPNRFELN